MKMEKDALIGQLDALATGRAVWDFDRDTYTHTATVGDYTLKVTRQPKEVAEGLPIVHADRHDINALWSVTHVRYGTLMEPVPALVITYAKREAIDFTRAHVQGHYEPQHAE